MQNKLIYKVLLGAVFATVFAIVTIPLITQAQILYKQFQASMTLPTSLTTLDFAKSS